MPSFYRTSRPRPRAKHHFSDNPKRQSSVTKGLPRKGKPPARRSFTSRVWPKRSRLPHVSGVHLGSHPVLFGPRLDACLIAKARQSGYPAHAYFGFPRARRGRFAVASPKLLASGPRPPRFDVPPQLSRRRPASRSWQRRPTPLPFNRSDYLNRK